MKDISVITSTIGRKDLRQCILSVQSQTIPAEHFVFVNGREFEKPARAILAEFPKVHAFYLPFGTGNYGVGCSMADVFAAAPYLTTSKWIAFLDDDNFYDPNHIETLMTMSERHSLDWAYSLRRLVDANGSNLCDDNWDSLGHFPCAFNDEEHIVDNSCYFVKRELAVKCGRAWTALPYVADRCFFMALDHLNLKAGCTGLSSVNYRVGNGVKMDPLDPRAEALTRAMLKKFHGNFPWRRETIFPPTANFRNDRDNS